MIFPPHSLYLTKPFDVRVFSRLKKYMATEIEPFGLTSVARI